MAIIRIFIRSIVLKKKKKNLRDNASGRAFTFTAKGQVILRGKPNKAVQVNCSQGFPFHPLFFSMSLVDFESIRNILEIETCTVVRGNFYRGHTRPGKPAFLTDDRSFIGYRSPRNEEVGFFQTYMLVYVWNIYHWPRETLHKTCL